MGRGIEEQGSRKLTASDSGRIALGGAELHYERKGSRGVPIVFLHGFGGDLHIWDGLWNAVEEGRAAVRYDLRGFGRSTIVEDRPFDHGEDLVALLEALAVARCHLVGISMGGSIALNFALDRPAHVNRLVLVSPGMIAWDWSDEWRQLWRAIASKARAGSMDEARALWWDHPLFATTREGPGADALRQSITRYSGQQWISDAHVDKLPDVERVHALTLPTLLLTGTQDMADFQLIADILESVESVERVDFAGRGHLLPLEIPEEMAHRTLAFLR